MIKPSQYEIDTCREVLEYFAADLQQNEPGATMTLDDVEATLGALPSEEDEFGEVD